jgi:hypothetical protein
MNRRPALTALAVVLAAGLVGLSGARQSAAAAARPGSGCILGIICLPTGSPSPTPSQSPLTPSQSPPAPGPPPTSGGLSPTGSPSGAPGPASSAGPAPSPGPASSAGPAPSPGPASSAGPAASPSPSASGTAPAGKENAAVKHAAVTAGLVASAAGSVLTAGSATMTGFAYQGNVDMPAGGGGTVTMMEFTADSIALAGGVAESVTQDGITTVTSSPALAFSGSVTLYATRLSGSLGGIPLTFTPSTISEVLLSVANLLTRAVPITLTAVTAGQPLVSADALRTGALTIGFGG